MGKMNPRLTSLATPKGPEHHDLIESNDEKLAGQCSRVQTDKDSKLTAKSTQNLLKMWDVIQRPGLSYLMCVI